MKLKKKITALFTAVSSGLRELLGNCMVKKYWLDEWIKY